MGSLHSPFRKIMEYIKYILIVKGMKCGMCEEHIQSAIRNNFIVKKVKANRFKNEVEIISKDPLDEQKIELVIKSTGYPYFGVLSKESYVKKNIFQRLFKK